METHRESKFSTDYYFLDNGLLWSVCAPGSEEELRVFVESLRSEGNPTSKRLVTTPFLLLESAGISPSAPKIELSDELVRKVANVKNLRKGYIHFYLREFRNLLERFRVIDRQLNVEDIKRFIMGKAEECYRNDPSLNPSLIKEKLIKNVKERASREGMNLLANHFGQVLDSPGFENLLVKKLAADYLYKFEYPREIHDKVYTCFAVDVLRSISSGSNISQYRAARATYFNLFSKLKRHRVFSEEKFHRVNKNLRMKFLRDLMDTEIVHFVTIGFFESDQLHPVTAFVQEPESKIVDRIAIYKSFLNMVKNFIDESSPFIQKRIPFRVLEPKSGFVFICDSSGRMEKCIDVSKIKSIDDV